MQLNYLPWSTDNYDDCVARYIKGELPTIDLQLSAKCSHASCVYCDSKIGHAQRGELSLLEIEKFFLKEKSDFQWLYICGLGEPLDDPKFPLLIDFFKNRCKISVFTNGLGITKDVAEFLSNHEICIILKLDSFNPKIFDKLLGKKGTAIKIYNSLNNLLSAGYPMTDASGNSRLALSIVPTRLNIKDIPNIVEYCKNQMIFPSIGELEYSGNAKKRYNDLHLTIAELNDLKERVDTILGTRYCRNLCPAAITSIHINNKGNCVVDRDTGLSCMWFMLQEPSLISIGNVREDNLLTLRQRVIDYRIKHIKMTIEKQKSVPNYPFGGCGGSPMLLLQSYLSMMQHFNIQKY